jgi:hypothetical protein
MPVKDVRINAVFGGDVDDGLRKWFSPKPDVGDFPRPTNTARLRRPMSVMIVWPPLR